MRYPDFKVFDTKEKCFMQKQERKHGDTVYNLYVSESGEEFTLESMFNDSRFDCLMSTGYGETGEDDNVLPIYEKDIISYIDKYGNCYKKIVLFGNVGIVNIDDEWEYVEGFGVASLDSPASLSSLKEFMYKCDEKVKLIGSAYSHQDLIPTDSYFYKYNYICNL